MPTPPSVHVTSAQLASHVPARHAWPASHVTLAHGSVTHSPVSTSQSSPDGQPSPRQLSSTQRPAGSRGSHTVPSLQTTPSHAKVHALLRHTHSATSSRSGAQRTIPSCSTVSVAHAAASQRGATQ